MGGLEATRGRVAILMCLECVLFCFVLTERLVEGFCAVWPGGCRSVSVGGEFVENLF